MTITINDKEIQLKYSFRAMMIYDNIAKKSFEPKGITEIVILFYSILMASDKTLEVTFDEFMDWLDDNQTIFNDFVKWLQGTIEKNNYLSQKTEADGEKKI